MVTSGQFNSLFIGRFKFCKNLSNDFEKPLIVVNHLEGHALSPKLITDLNVIFTFINFKILLYLAVKKLGKYKRLGTTIDDAVGEAFDKLRSR